MWIADDFYELVVLTLFFSNGLSSLEVDAGNSFVVCSQRDMRHV